MQIITAKIQKNEHIEVVLLEFIYQDYNNFKPTSFCKKKYRLLSWHLTLHNKENYGVYFDIRRTVSLPILFTFNLNGNIQKQNSAIKKY